MIHECVHTWKDAAILCWTEMQTYLKSLSIELNTGQHGMFKLVPADF